MLNSLVFLQPPRGSEAPASVEAIGTLEIQAVPTAGPGLLRTLMFTQPPRGGEAQQALELIGHWKSKRCCQRAEGVHYSPAAQ